MVPRKLEYERFKIFKLAHNEMCNAFFKIEAVDDFLLEILRIPVDWEQINVLG